VANILDMAQEATSGDRRRDYGHPKLNHQCTADLWSAWLSRKLGKPIVLTPEDVCHLNILQKSSRAASGKTTLDTWVDIAGYARNGEIVCDPGDNP
jgi:hypothetical protein